MELERTNPACSPTIARDALGSGPLDQSKGQADFKNQGVKALERVLGELPFTYEPCLWLLPNWSLARP